MKLEPMQVLLLWRLVVEDGELWKADIKPASLGDNKVRKALREARLISEETLRREIPGKRATRGLKITLEDHGWAWLSENLNAALPRSAAAADVLQGFLGKLQQHLVTSNLALADFLAPVTTAPSLEDKIVAAYRSLDTYGRGERVRIADLAKQLTQVDLTELQQALLTMQREDKLSLFVLDNPREITAEDRRCEITTVLGDKRHIIHMDSGR